jgi:hypothetical protein
MNLRKISAHDMNKNSSRSHLILNLHLEIDDLHTDDKTIGKICLVDLAGNERVKYTGNTNTNYSIKETSSINSSLSSLQLVMSELSKENNDNLIPYRNNKLTKFMSDCLGGNSKTIMIVNINSE